MLASKGRINDDELLRYRSMDCSQALNLLSVYCKKDSDFIPIKNSHTHRWNVEVSGRHFELLTTGPKWFDTRSSRGGGGAVDLTMYLFGLDFKQAIWKLRECSPNFPSP